MPKDKTEDIYALPKCVRDSRNLSLKQKTYEQLEEHIKCHFTHFYVHNFGDFHHDAVRALQELKRKYPHIHIHLVLVRDFRSCIGDEMYARYLYQGVEMYSFQEKDAIRDQLYADIEHVLVSTIGGSKTYECVLTDIFSVRSKAYLKTLKTKKVG